MKMEYKTPRAEKLEFDYTSVVVASEKGKHGDNGNKHGCAGGPIPGNPGGKTHGNGNRACKSYYGGYGI